MWGGRAQVAIPKAPSSQSSHTHIPIPRANLEGPRTGKLGFPEPWRLVQGHTVKKEGARVGLMACVLSKVLLTPWVWLPHHGRGLGGGHRPARHICRAHSESIQGTSPTVWTLSSAVSRDLIFTYVKWLAWGGNPHEPWALEWGTASDGCVPLILQTSHPLG